MGEFQICWEYSDNEWDIINKSDQIYFDLQWKLGLIWDAGCEEESRDTPLERENFNPDSSRVITSCLSSALFMYIFQNYISKVIHGMHLTSCHGI